MGFDSPCIFGCRVVTLGKRQIGYLTILKLLYHQNQTVWTPLHQAHQLTSMPGYLMVERVSFLLLIVISMSPDHILGFVCVLL